MCYVYYLTIVLNCDCYYSAYKSRLNVNINANKNAFLKKCECNVD